jgi:hypothetical protein
MTHLNEAPQDHWYATAWTFNDGPNILYAPAENPSVTRQPRAMLQRQLRDRRRRWGWPQHNSGEIFAVWRGGVIGGGKLTRIAARELTRTQEPWRLLVLTDSWCWEQAMWLMPAPETVICVGQRGKEHTDE